METIGHAAVKQRFERTLARGRLASTYLFVGPESVGKRRFALELASALLCGAADPLRPLMACGRCESCRLIASGGGHPDLLIVSKPPGKSTLPIELFLGRPDHRNREGLCHAVAMKPFLATRRVAVIDDADDLSVESANCLLKTLEEPPAHSVLILIGTSLSKQLPTIRSRCQVVRFGALSEGEVRAVLARIGVGASGAGEPDAASLAAASGGTVAGALAAQDVELAAFRQEVMDTLERSAGFDPVRFGVAVLEQVQAGGANPATRRDRLKRIIGYAVEHDRSALVECPHKCIRLIVLEVIVRCIIGGRFAFYEHQRYEFRYRNLRLEKHDAVIDLTDCQFVR
ncbi:MAG: AAA family ATPase [Planctomycetota bacterium]